MMSPLRLAFLVGTFLTASGMAQADSALHVQPIRFVCNGDGRCFENGALDRPDALERDGPRDFDQTRRDGDHRRRDRYDDDDN